MIRAPIYPPELLEESRQLWYLGDPTPEHVGRIRRFSEKLAARPVDTITLTIVRA